MSSKEEKIENQSISQLLLTKLYDQTGNDRGCNKGFILFSVDKTGKIIFISKFSDSVTEIALTTSATNILTEMYSEIEDDD
jgi:hypothetical protein